MFSVCVAAITNHDEYSLIRELTDEEREKTLTLRRRDQKKMDEMKKKLHTDERKTATTTTPAVRLLHPLSPVLSALSPPHPAVTPGRLC